jgi:hypothetical protein
VGFGDNVQCSGEALDVQKVGGSTKLFIGSLSEDECLRCVNTLSDRLEHEGLSLALLDVLLLPLYLGGRHFGGSVELPRAVFVCFGSVTSPSVCNHVASDPVSSPLHSS